MSFEARPPATDEPRVTRFRLRFQLQEIDLRLPTTTIGRDQECDVTLDDPLVSRRHARVHLSLAGAAVEDLHSRNGVRVNGALVDGRRELAPGDRVRVGSREFVFCVVERRGTRWSRTTGRLRVCARCRQTYAREASCCSACGTSTLEEEGAELEGFGEEEASTGELEAPAT